MCITKEEFKKKVTNCSLTGVCEGVPSLGNYPVTYEIKKNKVVFNAQGLMENFKTELSKETGLIWITAVKPYDGNDTFAVEFLDNSRKYKKVKPTPQQVAFYKFMFDKKDGEKYGKIHAFHSNGTVYLTENFSYSKLKKSTDRMFEQ